MKDRAIWRLLGLLLLLAMTLTQSALAVTYGTETDYGNETTYTPTIYTYPGEFSWTIDEGDSLPAKNLLVGNVGGGTLNYTITDNLAWLAVAPGSGSLGKSQTLQHSLSLATSSLAPAVYNGSITISAPGAVNTPKTIPVNLTVRAIPPVSLLRPNGGETWVIDGFGAVEWRTRVSQAGTRVAFELWNNGAKVMDLGEDESATGQHAKQVQVPAVAPGANYKLRVVSMANPSFYDESETPYSIQEPALRLLSPNGGETLKIGEKVQVRWRQASGDAGSAVRVKLFRDGVLKSELGDAPSQLGDNLAEFVIPEVSVSEEYELRLFGLSNGSPNGLWDKSNATFAIVQPALRVLNPNGGQEWEIGKPAAIAWKQSDEMGEQASVRFDLYRGSAKVASLPATVPSSPGENAVNIRVPVLAEADNYKLRVTNVANPAQWDESDQPFRIKEPPVRVFKPNGGDKWVPTMAASIGFRYTPELTGTQFALELWRGGQRVASIGEPVTVAASPATVNVTVPLVPAGADYKLRVLSTQTATYFDDSDEPFTIENAPVQLLRPNGGELWTATLPALITYKSNPRIAGTVLNIQLWRGATKVADLGSDTNTSGETRSKTITVPRVAAGADYAIKLVSAYNASFSDTSDRPFTIQEYPVRVVTPNGGQSWLTGQQVEIRFWLNPKVAGTSARLELLLNGAKVQDLGAAWVSSTTGEGVKTITVPNVAASSGYKVRAISVYDGTFVDESDAAFTINPSVTVVTPNGGDNWTGGTKVDLRWRLFNQQVGTAVYAQLWRSGRFVANLGSGALSSPTSSGWARVDLPRVITSSYYKVRVKSSSNQVMWDESDNYFTIKSPPAAPTGLTANGGLRSVELAWAPNTEEDLVGYNVYRDVSATGAFSQKLNATPIRLTSFIDTAVSQGQTYYYKVAAVNRIPLESAKSAAVLAKVGVIIVSMNDYRGAPGKLVTMSINCPNAKGIVTKSMDFQVTYDKTLLTPVSVQKTPLTGSFTFMSNVGQASGQLNISGNSLNALTIVDEGRLVEITFRVSSTARVGAVGSHVFVSASMYDQNIRPLTVDYTDKATFTVAADYIRGDVNGDGKVDSADVQYLLEAVAGRRQLTPIQFAAADLNGDGALTVADVTLLRRLAVGLSLSTSGPARAGAELQAADLLATGQTYNVSLPASASAAKDEVVSIPVRVSTANGIAGAEVTVNYDPLVLQFQSATTTSLTKDFILSSDKPAGNQVRLFLVGMSNLTGGAGDLAVLKFKVLGNLGETSPLTMAKVTLSDDLGVDLAGANTVNPVNGLFTVVKKNAARDWGLYE